MILPNPFSYLQSVDKYMKLNGWSFLNLSENGIREIMKAFDSFYYVNGRFPINNNLISAPDGQTPDFIKLRFSNQKLLPSCFVRIV